MNSDQIVSTRSDAYWEERLARMERSFQHFKQSIERRNKEQGEREQFMRDNSNSRCPKGTQYVLKTNDELRAYVAGVVAVFSIFLGRGVTIEEVEKTFEGDAFGIAAHLAVTSLDEYGIGKLLPLTPAGLTEWGLDADVVISDGLKHHFENI